MNKDVIYIDVEDDITAIIGKVKDAREKIVALVPPKRVGILQSAVNLRLLGRAAEQSGKRLVLITNNSALMALAAAAKIPVAKNLQSKPAMAVIPALEVDDGEDVIDGAQLPIGEHAKMADTTAAASPASDPAIDAAVRDNAAEVTPRALPPMPGQPLRKPRAKRGVAVPNFDKFRKKLALIIGGGILLLAFLIWAIFFSAHAKILITARTTDQSANPKVTLGADLATDQQKSTLKSTTQQIKKQSTVDFTATGSKEVGNKASGQVVFQNCETETDQTIPSGTTLNANGNSYVTKQDVVVPAASGSFLTGCNPGMSDAVPIEAAEVGKESNTPNGTQFSVAGHVNNSTQYLRAVASTDIDGGSSRQIKVVSKSDVQKASDELARDNSDDMKKQLADKFGDSVTVVDQTFKVDKGEATSSPAVDAEAPDGKAKLTSTVTYSMQGVEKAELDRFLDAYFAKQIDGKNDQRVYDNGASKVTFSEVESSDENFSAVLVATAQIGPKIDDQAIKRDARGKRYGEIQSSIEQIDGVDNVDIKFSPFWVSAAPNNEKRISVEFKLNESK